MINNWLNIFLLFNIDLSISNALKNFEIIHFFLFQILILNFQFFLCIFNLKSPADYHGTPWNLCRQLLADLKSKFISKFIVYNIFDVLIYELFFYRFYLLYRNYIQFFLIIDIKLVIIHLKIFIEIYIQNILNSFDYFFCYLTPINKFFSYVLKIFYFLFQIKLTYCF